MTTLPQLADRVIVWLADPTPTPLQEYEGDPNLITPGVIGFIATFLVALITVFLILDMTRRVRRVRYRSEVREQLEAERLAEEGTAEEPGKGPTTPVG